MTPIMQAAAIAVITLGTGTAAVTVTKKDVPDFAAPAGSWQPSNALDGKIFKIKATIKGTGERLPDDTLMSFKDGGF